MVKLPAMLFPALALGFAAVSPALAASLVPVGSAGTVTVYVDKDSIRRQGSEVRASLEWRWSRPTEVAEMPGRTYRLERQVQVSNCANRSYAVAEGTQYADDRGTDPVTNYSTPESALAYSVAPARTIRATVVNFVCDATPAPAKKG